MQVKLSGNNYSIEAKGNQVVYNEQMDNVIYKKSTIIGQIPIMAVAVALVIIGFILGLVAISIIILLVSAAYFGAMFYNVNKVKAYYLLTDTDIYVFNNMGVNNHKYEECRAVEVNKDSKILTIKFDVAPKKLTLYLGDKMEEFTTILSDRVSSEVKFEVKQKK